mmetsp:Transcript_94047/g.265589  ORF Transcript_94047/g.265589 Transcript_94047/m.265589 type:complete len:310 (+) Transcript_94047:511-1440(+)
MACDHGLVVIWRGGGRGGSCGRRAADAADGGHRARELEECGGRGVHAQGGRDEGGRGGGSRGERGRGAPPKADQAAELVEGLGLAGFSVGAALIQHRVGLRARAPEGRGAPQTKRGNPGGRGQRLVPVLARHHADVGERQVRSCLGLGCRRIAGPGEVRLRAKIQALGHGTPRRGEDVECSLGPRRGARMARGTACRRPRFDRRRGFQGRLAPRRRRSVPRPFADLQREAGQIQPGEADEPSRPILSHVPGVHEPRKRSRLAGRGPPVAKQSLGGDAACGGRACPHAFGRGLAQRRQTEEHLAETRGRG